MMQDAIGDLKEWMRAEGVCAHVTGISGPAMAFFLSRYLLDLGRPSLFVFPGRKEAEAFHQSLAFFLGERAAGERLHRFSGYDISPLSGLSPHQEVIRRRLSALHALLGGKDPIVITSLDALAFRILPKKAFVQAIDYLEAGEELDRDSFIRKLQASGYQRTSLVEEAGDYALRGGVLDVFPPTEPYPLRLEFWGDRLESIRTFDPLSQRSLVQIQEATLLPASEILVTEGAMKRARSMGRLPPMGEEGVGFPGKEAWLNHFYGERDTLLSYLPQKGVLVRANPGQWEGVLRKWQERFHADVERFRKEAGQKGAPFPETTGLFLGIEEILEAGATHPTLLLDPLALSREGPQGRRIHLGGVEELGGDLFLRLSGKGRVTMAPLAEKITEWTRGRAGVVVVSRTEQQAERLRRILETYGVATRQIVSSWQELQQGAGLSLCIGRLSKGFLWPDLGLYVISEDEVFGPKAGRQAVRRKARFKDIPWSSLSQLKAGDFVVHEEHGIGRYAGLVTLEIQGSMHDFVIIEYANQSRLYIPAERVSILQKYAGAEDRDPKLDELGGHAWALSKEKAKNSVKQIAGQLVELYAVRKYRTGHMFSGPDQAFREFEASFEHEETEDQVKAVEDVIEDMMSERPMDRLICGDVGFGKTEVALRAAFKAMFDGRQVALLVPTTVLAEQHFETFRKRLAPYPCTLASLSRFKSRAEQQRILAELRSGKLDMVIGTHRLLQEDVSFKDLGLLIVDEEQRFGVKQKERLKKYRALVDVLALTATPVPRTLQMSMVGVRDLSLIETPPAERLAIETYLSPFDEALIARAIRFELERGGQVFFVHNRVQTLPEMLSRLLACVPEARMDMAHGQMKGQELEEAMLRFLRREIDVLVCSTIIESGLDIPSANTIVINEADRLGLAQIYQLRGRVGRASEKAYAYLLLSDGVVLTRDAEKRLKALMDFSQLGAGLHLAMHDLKIRGGGNILGYAQSGHISAVGYELYLRLIQEAVAELKGEVWREEVNPEIHINLPSFLPETYIRDTDVRLNLYRRLSALLEKQDLEEIAEEIRDRFGPFPPEVRNLLGIMAIRILLKRLGVVRLDATEQGLLLTFCPEPPLDRARLLAHIQRQPRIYRMLSPQKLGIQVPFSPAKALGEVEKILTSLT